MGEREIIDIEVGEMVDLLEDGEILITNGKLIKKELDLNRGITKFEIIKNYDFEGGQRHWFLTMTPKRELRLHKEEG